MDTPGPESALDTLRRDVLGGLAALEERMRRHIDEGLAETRRSVGDGFTEMGRDVDAGFAEIRRDVDGRFTEMRHDVDGEFAEMRRDVEEGFAGLRRDVEGGLAEMRRHSVVLAEGLMTKLDVVAEGVQLNNERLDRFQVEVRARLATVGRRLLRLEARLPRKRRR